MIGVVPWKRCTSFVVSTQVGACGLGGREVSDQLLWFSRETLDDIPAFLPCGPDHGPDDGKIAGALGRSEPAGDFLPQFHHAGVPLGLIIGERNIEVGQEPQDVSFAIVEAQQQVVADASRRSAATGDAVAGSA